MKLERITGELIEGTFIKENTRRFSCQVEINGEMEQCYVASSSKLEQFVPLKNNKVKLSKNNPNSKFKYTLCSVKYLEMEILLNLKIVNEIIKEFIETKNLFEESYTRIRKEITFKGFKSDLILEKGEKIELVEIKTVIGTSKIAIFPSLTSNRALKQLHKLKTILEEGGKVKYIIVALSPSIEKITINPDYKEYKLCFEECRSLGMEVVKIKLNLVDKEIKYKIL